MKKFTIILMLALMVSVAAARVKLPFHNVQVKDEDGRNVTTISSVEIYAPDTTTNAVIYSDRALQNVITIPMTTSSTNTTLSNGNFFWYGPDGYDFSITDGSNIMTNAGHLTRTASGNQMTFPSYLTAISSTTYSDAQSATWGTGGDVVNQWINSASALRWTPSADGSAFDIGVSGTTANMDFNVYVGTALGLKLDEGAATLIIDGLTTSINASSNFNTNINTGTSTGAVTIGSSTAGAITIDSTSTATFNSDAAFSITTSDGSADITIDATAGSVNLVSGEDAAAAISIVANVGTSETIVITNTLGTSESAINIDATAGGIDIDFATAKNMAIDGGQFIFTSNEDVAGAFTVTANTGTSETIVLTNTQGTAESAFNIDATAGGIDIDFATAKNMAINGGQFIFTSNEDVAGAFTVTVNTGASETIVLTNTQGTDEAAFNIDATAGGIDVDFATGKNMAVTGGQFIFTSNEDVASAFSVITNTGTSETITLVNTQGTGTGAVTVTTTAAGDIDINSGDDITIDAADDMAVTVVGDYTLAVTGATVLPNDILLKATVAIADTEMDNLAATPKQLVAAVAGNTIELVSAIFALDWVSVAWTEPSAPDDLVIRYTDGTGAIVSQLLDATGFATATEDTVAFIGPNVANAAGAAVASVAVTEAASTNKGLFLHNTGSEWTNSGDSQVSVIVYYRLHTTAELGL